MRFCLYKADRSAFSAARTGGGMKPILAHPDRKTIQSLFNAIPSRYDFLNSFFSLGLDHYWRKKLVSGSEKGGGKILDLGVGTGKSLAAFLKAKSFEYSVGCDFSENMLLKSRERLGNLADFLVCDFHELPFSSDAFDLVTGSFILRSVQNMQEFLREVKRILKPNGKSIFLELTRPKNKLVWNLAYRPYLNFYIPTVGKVFSRHDHAYQFLSQSIQSFVDPADLKGDFESVGFTNVSYQSLSLGSATIIQGNQP